MKSKYKKIIAFSIITLFIFFFAMKKEEKNVVKKTKIKQRRLLKMKQLLTNLFLI